VNAELPIPPDRPEDDGATIRRHPELLDRVVVVGDSGSGKSTVAARLAGMLGLEHIELDALFHLPAWREPDAGVFRERVRAAIAPFDRWVVSGNYLSRQQDVTWPLARTVVWLDLPLRVTVPRTLARSWRRWRTHELLWETNYESFWPHLRLWDERESLVAYTLRHHREHRRSFEALQRHPAWRHLHWVRLRSPREAAAWLAALEPSP
jgi:adenylate kinase family enzyme